MTIADPHPGGWALHEVLTSTEMNAIRTGLLQAIDGVGGGSYSPSADLILGGSHELKIDAKLRMRTGSQFIEDAGASATFNGTWVFNTAGDFNANVNINDDAIFGTGGSSQFHAGHAVHFATLSDVHVDSVTVTFDVPMSWGQPQADSGTLIPNWEFSPAGWLADTNAGDTAILFSLPMIAGDVISAIYLDLLGAEATSHGGTDPETTGGARASAVLLEGDATGAPNHTLTTVHDTGQPIASYDAAHTLTLDGTTTSGVLPYTALSKQYALKLLGEHGTNSFPRNTRLYRIRMDITRKTLVSSNTFGA